MRFTFIFILFLSIVSCKKDKQSKSTIPQETQTDEILSKSEDSIELKAVSKSEDSTNLKAISTKEFTEFKVLDSKNLTKAEIWDLVNQKLDDFTDEDYHRLIPIVVEQDILSLQEHVKDGSLNYEELTKFYLYRIRKYDRENPNSLNSVIALNANLIDQA